MALPRQARDWHSSTLSGDSMIDASQYPSRRTFLVDCIDQALKIIDQVDDEALVVNTPGAPLS
jgi:hypothetical protein